MTGPHTHYFRVLQQASSAGKLSSNPLDSALIVYAILQIPDHLAQTLLLKGACFDQ